MAYDYSEIGCKLFYANFNGNWVYFGQYTSHEDVLYFINKQTDFEHDFGTNIVTIGYLTSYKPNIIGSDIESLIKTKVLEFFSSVDEKPSIYQQLNEETWFSKIDYKSLADDMNFLINKHLKRKELNPVTYNIAKIDNFQIFDLKTGKEITEEEKEK